MTALPVDRVVEVRAADELPCSARIGSAWKELRRGAAMVALRDHLLGVGPDALEPGQMDTLDLLVQGDAWRMSDLADALRVDPSTATRAVQRLVRNGLAERSSCADDGRVVRVTASALGRARHRAIDARRRELMATMLGAFSEGERSQLADLLDRLVAALDAAVASMRSEGAG